MSATHCIPSLALVYDHSRRRLKYVKPQLPNCREARAYSTTTWPQALQWFVMLLAQFDDLHNC